LLAAQIEDTLNVIRLENTHDTQRDWKFFREAAQKMLWPHIDAEYQQELQGIAEGARSKGAKLDVWDIVALNGGIELPEYYVPWLNSYWELYQGRQDRDRAQQLVVVCRWRTVDCDVRYSA
jgi:hypothetical protein